MFQRNITEKIKSASANFYAVTVVGPRQSGKTTLLKQVFPQHRYLNLEELDILQKIKSYPKGFISNKNEKWIIDEAQKYPELFSYLLGIIDNNKELISYKKISKIT